MKGDRRMKTEIKSHVNVILELLKKHKYNYGYGTIAPVNACLGEGECLFFDFGVVLEEEQGQKLQNKYVQRKLYYILSKLADEGRVEISKSSFYYGRVNHYEISK